MLFDCLLGFTVWFLNYVWWWVCVVGRGLLGLVVLLVFFVFVLYVGFCI